MRWTYAVALVLLLGCAARGDAPVRAALEVLREVIDPAYAFAVDACRASSESVVAEVRAEAITHAEGLARRTELDKRCQATIATFEAMRVGHARAAELVERGELAEAQQIVATVRARFRELRREATP